MRQVVSRRLCALVVVAGALGVQPQAAPASYVEISGTTMRYIAAPGERNSIMLTGYSVADGAPITAGPGCQAGASSYQNSASCWGTVDRIYVELGDGDDFAQLDGIARIPIELHGGPGGDAVNGGGERDLLYGGAGSDQLDGGDGDDLLDGGPGSNNLRAGAGDDHAVGGDGNDNIWGGAGSDVLEGRGGGNEIFGNDSWGTYSGAPPDGDDTLIAGSGGGGGLVDGEGGSDVMAGPGMVRFLSAPGGVRASLDGKPNDGPVGESDNVMPDITAVQGTRWADDIEGGAGDEQLLGYEGDDRIQGGGGNDNVDGAEGDDVLSGGNEPLAPPSPPFDGNDIVAGGPGDDLMRGGAGIDSIGGDQGADRLFAREPAAAPNFAGERVGCGPGLDSAETEDSDEVRDCESLERVHRAVDDGEPPPWQPPDTPADTPGGEPPVVEVTSARQRHGDVAVSLRCKRKHRRTCRGRVVLRDLKGDVLGRRGFSTRSGRKKGLHVALDRDARRTVRKRGDVSAMVAVRVQKATRATRFVRLRAAAL